MIFIDGSNFLAGLNDFQKKMVRKFLVNIKNLGPHLLNRACEDRAMISPAIIKINYYGSETVPDSCKGDKEKTISANDISKIS